MGLKVPYLSIEAIERDAQALLADYGQARGVSLEAPIPIDDIVEKHLKIGIEFDDTHRLFGVPRSGARVAPDILGAIFFDEKRIVIDESLDPDANPAKEGRYRFTVAHEVGHWQLHRAFFAKGQSQRPCLEPKKAPSVVCRSSRAKEPIEVQADQYASCILMPRQAIQQQWIATFNTDRPVAFDATRSQPWISQPKPVGFRKLSDVMAGIIEELNKNIGTVKYHPADHFFNKIAQEMASKFLVSTQAMRIRLERLGYFTELSSDQE